jgi:hypothetical protein
MQRRVAAQQQQAHPDDGHVRPGHEEQFLHHPTGPEAQHDEIPTES